MIYQKTIKNPVTLEGMGLQTGARTRLVLKSSPADGGINFIRTDLPGRPSINTRSLIIDDKAIGRRRTVIGVKDAQIHTTEHFLAAMSGLGIDNVTVEIDNRELPGLDGSAKNYVDAIDRAGIVELPAPKKEFIVDKPMWCGDKNSFLAAFPYDGLRISYFLSYPVKSIGQQFLSIDVSEDTFRREIAPARTFCMKSEALILKVLGFGKGADFNNTLVMGRRGPVKNSLRFSDEHVRHKILDLMGDVSLVGVPLRAHLVAVKSGHSLNSELVKKLKNII